MVGSLSEAFVSVVVWSVVWRLGYFTSALLLPLLSLGWVKVMPANDDAAAVAWHCFARAPHGTVSVEANTAAFLGCLLWVALTLAGFLLLRS